MKQAVPIVKWVGGKRQLQGHLLPLLSRGLDTAGSKYYEPFLGGGAMFFALEPRKSVLADVNIGLINLYRSIRSFLPDFLTQMEAVENHYNNLNLEEQEQYFYSIRELFNSEKRIGINQAVNFLFLNKACFNGTYRENLKGEFNVPFGKKTKINLGNEENLRSASISLAKTELHISSFEETVRSSSRNDLVYFDPPYIPLTATSAFTNYAARGFGIEDQYSLRDKILELDEKGVKVALSNSSAPLVRELYSDFNITELSASRNISASSSGRSPVTELLITNFL